MYLKPLLRIYAQKSPLTVILSIFSKAHKDKNKGSLLCFKRVETFKESETVS